MLRPMTHEEETHLVTAILSRDLFSMEAGVEVAAKVGLPADLTQLVRAGITYEEVEDEGGLGGYSYVFNLPTAGGSH